MLAALAHVQEGQSFLEASHTKRSVDICANKAISSVAFNAFFAESRNPSLCQADADVNLACTDGGDHVSSAGGEGYQRGMETVMFLGKVDGR